MKLETKKFLKYLVGLFFVVLITRPLPHTSYSIIEYIIRPFKLGNSTMNLSGIIPLILFIFCVRGIFRLEKYRNDKVITFLVIVIAILPIMNWTIDMTRTGYHFISRDGLNSVEIEDSNMSMVSNLDTITLNVNLFIKDYIRSNKEFKIRVFLPKTMSESLNLEYYELDNTFMTHGGSNKLSVDEDIEFQNVDYYKIVKINHSDWYQEKVVYELYNENQTIKFIEYGN